MTQHLEGRRIFISYRREDSSGYVGRLFDALAAEFGRESMFMDIDTLAPGQDFVEAIDDALSRCSAVLVVIGPRWVTSHDGSGRPRLDAPDDYVRIEIERALSSHHHVIPILVGGASMPAGSALPASIESLSRHHALELSDRSWHADVRTLLESLTSNAASAPPAATTAVKGFTREERKVVSILFCDLVGFTAASEDADPEDVRSRLRPYHAKLREVIEGHGGTVEKFIGDAVMAVFGAPAAHEDDAERAIRAGLGILEAIEKLNGANAKLQLRVRIGINTGQAVVTLGAHPELGEGFVTGDVVNTASRLQGVAPVDGIAVAESTYRQTERVFTFAQLEPAEVKGKSERLTMWQPTAPRARTRIRRDACIRDSARRPRLGARAAHRHVRTCGEAALVPACHAHRRTWCRQESALR